MPGRIRKLKGLGRIVERGKRGPSIEALEKTIGKKIGKTTRKALARRAGRVVRAQETRGFNGILRKSK